MYNIEIKYTKSNLFSILTNLNNNNKFKSFYIMYILIYLN